MSLNKTAKDALKARGIDVDALVKAIQNPIEVDFTPGELKGYHSDADVEEIKKNVKEAHEKNYPEIFGRQMNKDHDLGLSANDAKDTAKVIAALESKIEKKLNLNPDAKVTELQTSLKKLQESTIPELENKAKEWEGKYREREIFDTYAGVIPDNANKYLTKEEHVNRVRKVVALGENGIAVDPSTNQPYKDKKEKPVLFKDKVAELYTTNETWVNPADTTQKNQFHHSTSNGDKSGGNKGAFNYDKALETLNGKYDRTTPEGRQMFQQELTALQVNAQA